MQLFFKKKLLRKHILCMFQSIGKFHTVVGGLSKPKALIYSEGGGDFSGSTPPFPKRLYNIFLHLSRVSQKPP